MNPNDKLIRKTFIGIWMIHGTGVLLSIACVLIDAVFTGQFLGPEAVAAAGLVNPITLIVNMLMALIGSGLGIVCTRYMGMAKLDMVNKVFSVVMTVNLFISVSCTLILFFMAPGIANALGAKTGSPEIIKMTEDYLKGYALAIVPLSYSLGLSGLMILDNDRGRGLLTMVATLLSDVLFDALNVTVFHGGMFGMAVATALSQVVGCTVVFSHFLRKDRMLRFSPKGLDLRLMKDVLLSGVPNSVSVGSIAVKVMIFNAFLLSISTSVAVAGFSAANSLFTVVNSICLGFYLTASSLASFLFGEEDRKGIVKTLRIAVRISMTMMFVISVVLYIFAERTARMLLDAEAFEQIEFASRFIRMMAVQYLFFVAAFPLSGIYQGVGKNALNYVFVALREGVIPVACSLGLGMAFGIGGFEWGLALSGLLTLISCSLIPTILNKRLSIKYDDVVLIDKDFGSKEEDLFEASMRSMEEVSSVSAQVMEFCKERGKDHKVAFNTALCIEEMAGNSITYGIKKGKNVNVDIRVICHPDSMVIRIRDDGAPFDPLAWYELNNSDDPETGLGIRLILGLAKDVKYIPAMGLNSLMISL